MMGECQVKECRSTYFTDNKKNRIEDKEGKANPL